MASTALLGKHKTKEYMPCCDPVKSSWPNSVYRWLWDYTYHIASSIADVFVEFHLLHRCPRHCNRLRYGTGCTACWVQRLFRLLQGYYAWPSAPCLLFPLWRDGFLLLGRLLRLLVELCLDPLEPLVFLLLVSLSLQLVNQCSEGKGAFSQLKWGSQL